MRPAERRSGRRHSSPSEQSQANFSSVTSTSPKAASVVVLPESRAEMRQMSSAWSSVQRERMRISRRRCAKLELAHERCAARARSTAAFTSAADAALTTPSRRPVLGSKHGTSSAGAFFVGLSPIAFRGCVKRFACSSFGRVGSGPSSTSAASSGSSGTITCGTDGCQRRRTSRMKTTATESATSSPCPMLLCSNATSGASPSGTGSVSVIVAAGIVAGTAAGFDLCHSGETAAKVREPDL